MVILKPRGHCSKTFPCVEADDEQRRQIGSGYDGCLFRKESQLVVEAWGRLVHVHAQAGEDGNVSPPLPPLPACIP
jgi:hypothetical protein